MCIIYYWGAGSEVGRTSCRNPGVMTGSHRVGFKEMRKSRHVRDILAGGILVLTGELNGGNEGKRRKLRQLGK